MTHGNDSVYPVFINETNIPQWGCTKREHFASMAMQGMLANTEWALPMKDIATDAVNAADALINALNEKK